MTFLALTQNMTDAGIREEVNVLFDQYILDAFDAVDPIMDIGQQFAYIGIGIIALKVFMNEQTRADFFAYLKWVPLAFILLKYKVFARSIFQFYEGIGNSLKGNDVSWDILQLKIYHAQTKAMEDIGSSWSLFDMDWSALESLILSGMTSGITTFASIVSTVVFIGIKAMSVIYLFVLIVFGPLNIGLSFIPALSGMWKAWLQKFMSVCLWIPMLHLIDNFMLKIMERLIDSLLLRTEANLGLVLTSALLMLMNLFVYLKAPTLSNFIVQGMNVNAGQLKEKTKHYAKKAAQTAMDLKTGGTTKGVRTLIQ
ncbi:MAG: type IV secretion system protein [Allomuricauda sp.]